ncbi:MAG: hypothetical protein J6S79_02525 [Lachnospiraceae bacterium]|nr:hypothetical protein [Lachnospiraceae bacterium]
MHKKLRRIAALLIIFILCAGLLSACGEKEKDVKKGKKRNSDGYVPTSVVTPTEEPTPDVTGTPDVTPVLTTEPKAELVEVKDRTGAFSVMLPSNATVDARDGIIEMKTDTCYLSAFYLGDGFTGAIYDIDDFETMLPGENTLIDALDVGYYEMFGQVERRTINGVSCLVGPTAQAMVKDGSGFVDLYSRFIAYDCEEEFGIIIVWYAFTDKSYYEMTEQDWEEDAYWKSCAESLVQYHSPLEIGLRYVSEHLDDGSVATFLYEDGAIKEIEQQPGGGLTLKPYGTKDVQILIQHVPNTEEEHYDSTYEVYQLSRDAYGPYLTVGEAQADLGNYYWEMNGAIDGISYDFMCYVAYSYSKEKEYWFFIMKRPAGQEDAGEEDLFWSMIWSFRDLYMPD